MMRPSTALFVLLMVVSGSHSFDQYKVGNFTDALSKGFQHMAVHVNGDVYVGGVNNVYKLNSDLKLLYNQSTGPMDDASDNHNKILAIDSVAGNLVVCGSYLGFCEHRRAGDLSFIESSDIYVAADTADDSTVGIVAPGYDGKQMLYVGTTKTVIGYGWPLVSGRQLGSSELFRLIDVGTEINALRAHSDFTINYLFAFSHRHFTYFVDTQQLDPSNPNSEHVSKIARVCQERSSYYYDSFTEIRLHCTSDDKYVIHAAYLSRPGSDLINELSLDDRDELLFAAYTNEEFSSVICLYDMENISNAFSEAVKKCLENDGGSYTVRYLDGTCNFHYVYSKHFDCHAYGYRYANDESPDLFDAVVGHIDLLVTSIAVTVIGRHTVAFLGTNDGRLMKVHITSSTQSNVYEELSVAEGGGNILSDMEFDPTHRHVYVPTAKEVLKIKVEDCSQYESCTACFASLDPYCGWCTLERRCLIYLDCPRANQTSRWLDVFSDSSCVNISNIDPENSVPMTVSQKITLTVVELPSLSNQYQYKCVFGDSFMTVAERIGFDLTCETPHIDQRPDIPEGADHVQITLYVLSNETDTKFVQSDFYFYDCSSHSSCTDCVTNDWACNWCVYENRCTHYQESCPEDDQTSTVIGTNNRFNLSDIKGQSFCPQLDRQDREVLVPVNVDREIHVKTLNVYYKDDQSYYECKLTVAGILQSSPARRINESLVICNMRKYHYDSSVQEMIVLLSVKMNGNYIDDIHGFNVTLYDCSIDRRDFSHCLSELTTGLQLHCGWCKTSGTCEVQELCTRDEWLPYETTESCDDPVITEVWPLSGPYEGNTELLVRGNNLGKRFSDIVRIEVGGLPCALIEAAYSVSESVMCTTTRSERPNVSGQIVLHIIQAKSARSSQDFTYRDPTILDFTPKVGPKSGGTAVNIRGEYIDAGRNITADFDGFACLIKREQDVWNETTVRCKTSRINTTSSAKLRMHFDGAERLAPDSKSFRYTENPTVKSINPSRSFRSGGRQVNVTGTMFTSVQEPRMVLSSEDGIHVGQPCQVYSQSSMQCLSPAFYSGDSAGPENNDITVGFLMDAVKDLLQLDLDFTVVSDPVYFEFPEEGNMKEQSGKQLNIRGSDLNLACTSEEVNVSVGQAECIVESLSDVQLNCVPPEEELAAVNRTGSPTRNGYPEVRVEVGYQSFYIGYLKYRRADRLQTTTTIVVVSIIFLLVGIVATIGLGVILRNKIKDMDKRMDLANGIPKIMELTEMERDKRFQLLDYGDYAANMLFGGKNHDQVLNTSKKQTPADSRCLEDFRSLLRDKVFCVVFIRTLENRDDITPEDGSLIASLLTVVLHKEDHLMHFTEVLKVLLAEVVRNAVRGKRNAPLLERNNMITEKLVFNWFSLTLYKFIKFVVGKHLLRLVTSVQHEIEQNAEVTEVDIVHYLNDGEVKDNLDRLFTELLTMKRQQHNLFPPPIKYMFDYLGTLAKGYGSGDPKEVITLKTDSLMLIFWVKVIRCPQYLLDITPSEEVLASLDIAATMFTDICSTTKNSLEDENKEHISMFRPTLLTYFEAVKCLPKIDDSAFGKFLKSNYKDLEHKFDGNSSLCELLKYVIPCKDKVADALERNEHCKKENHAAKLEEVMSSFSVHDYEQIPSQYMTLQSKPNNVYERMHRQPAERITVTETEQTEGSLNEMSSSGEPPQLYQTLQAVQHPEYSALHTGPVQSIVASENNELSNKKDQTAREDEVSITVRSTDYEVTPSNYTTLKPKPVSVYEKLNHPSREETI